MQLADAIVCGAKQYQSQFTTICAPLQNYFGMNAISYVRINSKGKLINLHTHLPSLQHCLDQTYYNCDPSMVDPDNMTSGFAIGASYTPGAYTNIMLQDCIARFDLSHACSYVEKNKNEYNLFGFNAPLCNSTIIHRMIAEKKILSRFIRNIQKFLDENHASLQTIAVDFARIKGEVFYQQPGVVYLDSMENRQLISELEKKGLVPSGMTNISLTTQEKRCLRLYINNNTAKQVAVMLNLAPRTVESYLENIKVKMQCSYKLELINGAGVLESLGLL